MSAAPTVDCARLVPDIVDASPVRSPQALHSLIASRIANKTLVEIGTRNGDDGPRKGEGIASCSSLAVGVALIGALHLTRKCRRGAFVDGA